MWPLITQSEEWSDLAREKPLNKLCKYWRCYQDAQIDMGFITINYERKTIVYNRIRVNL